MTVDRLATIAPSAPARRWRLVGMRREPALFQCAPLHSISSLRLMRSRRAPTQSGPGRPLERAAQAQPASHRRGAALEGGVRRPIDDIFDRSARGASRLRSGAWQRGPGPDSVSSSCLGKNPNEEPPHFFTAARRLSHWRYLSRALPAAEGSHRDGWRSGGRMR